MADRLKYTLADVEAKTLLDIVAYRIAEAKKAVLGVHGVI